MFNKNDKRSFAVKKWILTELNIPEEKISDDFFRDKRREYYSGNNSPWGRAKSKGEKHYKKSKENHKISMNRELWKDYVNPFSKEYHIRKGMSEENADYQVRSRNKFCKEFWESRGYLNAEYMARCFNPGAYEYYESKNISREDLININNPTYIDYWLNRGHSEEEAKKLLSEFKPYCDEFWISRGKEKDMVSFRKQLLSDSGIGHYSAVSLKLFNSFPEYILNESMFGKEEKVIPVNKDWQEILGRKMVKPDFLYKERIIEFFGDYIHANPDKFYASTYLTFRGGGFRAKDKWLDDANRISYLKFLGYDVLVVWEGEFKKNKNLTIERCISFLTV